MKSILTAFFLSILFVHGTYWEHGGCAVSVADAAEAVPKKKVKTAQTTDNDRGLAVVGKNRDSRKRVALVIGNSNYRSSPLKNPANDAKSMASILRRLGFDVEEKTDLGYMEMNKTVESFGKRLRSGGVGLFYYAGHGMQVNGANYLIPVDAQIEDENEVRFKAVDAGLVLAKMEQAKSDVNIVVLDACRDNPFSRSFRSSSHGLASMDAPSGTFIGYATAPGKTAADGDGKNGLYTAELVKVLEIPGIPLEQVFKRTLKAVREKSASKQTPWVASNLEGEFYFTSPLHKSDLKPSEFRTETVAPETLREEKPLQIAMGGNFTDSTTGMTFVNVQGGCYEMGDSYGDGSPEEKPVHSVCVDNFAIGKYEVTQGQWKKIMGNNPSRFSTCGDNCPVEHVSWNNAQEFIQRLSKKSGRSYRLPTEAEWEYACRSGGKNEKYCGGNDANVVAWHEQNSGNETHSVGQKQPNGLGLFDMSGNVAEWVEDWYDETYYQESPRDNPKGQSTGKLRVLRGGMATDPWGRVDGGVRAAGRARNTPSSPVNEHPKLQEGFRIALPIQ